MVNISWPDGSCKSIGRHFEGICSASVRSLVMAHKAKKKCLPARTLDGEHAVQNTNGRLKIRLHLPDYFLLKGNYLRNWLDQYLGRGEKLGGSNWHRQMAGVCSGLPGQTTCGGNGAEFEFSR
jgi:hypothetical protein